MKFNRRKFLKTAVILGSAHTLAPAPKTAHAAVEVDERSLVLPERPFFTKEERLKVGYLCEGVFPDAVKLGAVEYIEQLLTAFEYEPPRIFAGGPFSARKPFPNHPTLTATNHFSQFLPLNRVQERAWRLRLYGSKEVGGGGPNDGVLGLEVGWRNLFRQGLATMDAPQSPLFDSKLNLLIKELTMEAILGAPEYGGNKNLMGWKIANYEGDVQPYGYAVYDGNKRAYLERKDFPLTKANPGSDPAPFGFLTKVFLSIMARYSKGWRY